MTQGLPTECEDFLMDSISLSISSFLPSLSFSSSPLSFFLLVQSDFPPKLSHISFPPADVVLKGFWVSHHQWGTFSSSNKQKNKRGRKCKYIWLWHVIQPPSQILESKYLKLVGGKLRLLCKGLEFFLMQLFHLKSEASVSDDLEVVSATVS